MKKLALLFCVSLSLVSYSMEQENNTVENCTPSHPSQTNYYTMTTHSPCGAKKNKNMDKNTFITQLRNIFSSHPRNSIEQLAQLASKHTAVIHKKVKF